MTTGIGIGIAVWAMTVLIVMVLGVGAVLLVGVWLLWGAFGPDKDM